MSCPNKDIICSCGIICCCLKSTCDCANCMISSSGRCRLCNMRFSPTSEDSCHCFLVPNSVLKSKIPGNELSEVKSGTMAEIKGRNSATKKVVTNGTGQELSFMSQNDATTIEINGERQLMAQNGATTTDVNNECSSTAQNGTTTSDNQERSSMAQNNGTSTDINSECSLMSQNNAVTSDINQEPSIMAQNGTATSDINQECSSITQNNLVASGVGGFFCMPPGTIYSPYPMLLCVAPNCMFMPGQGLGSYLPLVNPMGGVSNPYGNPSIDFGDLQQNEEKDFCEEKSCDPTLDYKCPDYEHVPTLTVKATNPEKIKQEAYLRKRDRMTDWCKKLYLA